MTSASFAMSQLDLKVSTMHLHMTLMRKFVDVQSSWKILAALLAKLEPGDMVALEAEYHRKCLINLCNRARALESTVSNKSSDTHLHGIAFAELVAFMEDLQKKDIAPVFKLTDLAFMCKT